MEFRKILEAMLEKGASDLHIKVGTHPVLRVDGQLTHMDSPPPTQKELEEVIAQVLTPAQLEEFETTREIDFGFQGLVRKPNTFAS